MTPCCGDGNCEAGENSINCPIDCPLTCSDGTKYGACSTNKLFCDNGELKNQCEFCGCVTWMTCNRLTKTCVDQGCGVRDGKYICSNTKLLVSGPTSRSDNINKIFLQESNQINFLESYLGFEGAYPVNLQFLDAAKFKETCGDNRGCEVGYAIWPEVALDNWDYTANDHEMNHAYVRDLKIPFRFNEALARFLTAQQMANSKGTNFQAELEAYHAASGMYLSNNEKEWTKSPGTVIPACIACNDPTASANGCEYLYVMVQFGNSNFWPIFLKRIHDQNLTLYNESQLNDEIKRDLAPYPPWNEKLTNAGYLN
ncbi:Uncharacterised protein [uncultured archaeon]|nr:Uncharacterised protein [uncultured archaeon]